MPYFFDQRTFQKTGSIRWLLTMQIATLYLFTASCTSKVAKAAYYDRFQTETIDLDHPDGFQIRTVLSLKKYDSPVPMLLLLQGTGCGTTSSMHITAHRLIEKYQVGVLTVDKRGTSYGLRQWFASLGCSEEFHKHDTMQVRKKHLLWTLDQLKKKITGWNGELLIVAGSMGGLMGIQVANAYPKTIAIATLGTGAGLIHSNNFKPLVECYQGKSCKDLDAKKIKQIEKVKNHPDHNENFEFYGLSERETWWKSSLDFDPLTSLPKVPYLLIHGTIDRHIQPESAKTMHAALKAQKSPATLLWAEESDHHWRSIDGKSHLKKVWEWIEDFTGHYLKKNPPPKSAKKARQKS